MLCSWLLLLQLVISKLSQLGAVFSALSDLEAHDPFEALLGPFGNAKPKLLASGSAACAAAARGQAVLFGSQASWQGYVVSQGMALAPGIFYLVRV